jgi:hypothetical protein
VSRRQVQRVGEAQHQRQAHDVPVGDGAGGDQREQRDRLQQRDRLGPHQQPAPVEAIDDDPAESAEQQARQQLDEAEEAQLGRRVRELEDQPRLRHGLQQIAGVRDQRSREQQGEVAIAEDRKRAGARTFGRGLQQRDQRDASLLYERTVDRPLRPGNLEASSNGSRVQRLHRRVWSSPSRPLDARQSN